MSCCGFIGTGFGGASGGSGGTRGGFYSAPEAWVRNNVPASSTDVALSALVSQSFDTIKMVRSGSIVGLVTRLSETITAGTLTVEVTINGVGTGFNIMHTNVANQNGGATTQAIGSDAYVVGDLIGVRFTSSVGFLPITTDLEAWVQLYEVPA